MNMDPVKTLSKAVSIPTVSANDAPEALTKFDEFHAFLKDTFPKFHEATELELVKERALLYKWKGTGKSSSKPFALIAHQDVVGIEEGTEDEWTHPPFDGFIDDEYIWGRGTSDTKCSLIGILQACENLIENGFTPSRDIYVCFGHNEEVISGGPESGAGCMARLLKERNVELEFVMDEGGAVVTDSFMGLTKPIATIGLAEKGYSDFRLRVRSTGGHTSEPPKEATVTMLSKLLVNLNKIVLKNTKVTTTFLKTLKVIGENKKGFTGFVLRHPNFFLPLIKKQLLADTTTAAMLRTTCTPTMLNAGNQPNVLPQIAEATLNARLITGDNRETIESYIREAADGIEYEIDYIDYCPPMPETSSDTKAYKLLAQLTEKIHGAIPFPYMVLAYTDSREYAIIADEIYRFYPFALTFDELGSMHSTNERIKIQSYLDGVKFYEEFIEGCCN